ncbi:hypothetical protein Acr_00g0100930 [Actinidia rufa]|uniref:Uncharacterized protein n=1 Tax=Actinidia rufa TaxID=165716 RepID=A0A7J0E060_9ERIC|nr:hypothetical protein Acr_00g0100930 [Actinidia rufa]
MTPKSMRSSRKIRQSLALVVSTPTMAAGQKRKAQSDTGKEKSNKKMGESSSTHDLERDPLYILEDRDQKRKSQRLGHLSKLSNTATTAIELSLSPSSSPSTPIHAPHASTSHTTSPPLPL